MRKVQTILVFMLLGVTVFAQVKDSTLLKEAEALHQNGVDVFPVSMDSALLYIQQAKIKYEATEYWDGMVTCLNDISLIYYYQKKFSAFEIQVALALEAAEQYLEKGSQTHAVSVNNFNTYYYSIGNYNKSIELIQEALQGIEKGKQSDYGIAILYQNLGNAYRFTGDYLQSLEYLKQAVATILKVVDKDHHMVARIFQNMGRTYNELAQIDSAFFYLEKSLAILEKSQDNFVFSYKIENQLLQAEWWMENGDLQQSWNLTQRVLKKTENNSPFYEVYAYEMLGQLHTKEGKYVEAIQHLTKAIAIAEKHQERNTPPFIAKRYQKLADAYQQLTRNQEALVACQKALSVLAPEYEEEGLLENPPIDQILAPKEALAIFEKKAQLLWSLSQGKNRPGFLEASLQTYVTATELIQNLRREILTVEAKNRLSEKTIPVYEGAIRSALALYENTQDTKYLEQAFFLAESNKALLLLESFNEQVARGNSGLPDSLLQREQDLKLELAFLQKSTLANDTIGESAATIRQKMFLLGRELDKLQASFEKNYPRYYQAKYQNSLVDLPSLQEQLRKTKSLLLEYFVGEEHIYLFAVKENHLEVVTLSEEKNILAAANRLRLLLDPNNREGSANQAYHNFTETAHELYQLLLAPITPQLHTSPHALIIVPDNMLNYVPFELLLSEAAGEGNPSYHPSQLAYLLEDYSISYDYSATFHMKTLRRTKKAYTQEFLGFAPSFKKMEIAAAFRSCQEGDLYSLKCSAVELEAINDIFGGKAHFAEEATSRSFREQAPDCRILHLATHACADEERPMYSKIFLTDDYISNYDLHNMHLGAELAVLSACNTGSGKMVKGEGVMSLARGFISAGCASSVMSMWSVNDCATADIMTYFYTYLKEGKAKHEALRLAKLHYLEGADQSESHPYYWAAFVAFGDTAPLASDQEIPWIVFGLLLLFSLLGLGYFKSR